MSFEPQQFINPCALRYDENRRNALSSFKEAVESAGFLNKTEKDHWELLGYLLTDRQLEKAKGLIISEDLKRLKMRQQLEKIKPKKE